MRRWPLLVSLSLLATCLRSTNVRGIAFRCSPVRPHYAVRAVARGAAAAAAELGPAAAGMSSMQRAQSRVACLRVTFDLSQPRLLVLVGLTWPLRRPVDLVQHRITAALTDLVHDTYEHIDQLNELLESDPSNVAVQDEVRRRVCALLNCLFAVLCCICAVLVCAG
jgi:hypothetical protein